MASRKSKPRIALVNPPAARAVLRDYYCSTRPKARYYWQPVDLLCMGAQLAGRADLLVMDAVAGRLSRKQALSILADFDPEGVFVLGSTLTLDQDLAFAAAAGQGRRVALGGEAALDPHFSWERHPLVQGLVLDFTARECADFLLGAEASGPVRTRGHVPSRPPLRAAYSMGLFPHELLASGVYRLPLWRGDFRSLLTDFGCPFSCSFCNSGSENLGFKLRDRDEISEEIQRLARAGTRRIYLRDMTFGADPAHADAVLEMLSMHRFEVRGFIRADQVRESFVKKLSAAGFCMVQIGVESPCPGLTRRAGKYLDAAKLKHALRLLRRYHILYGMHFLVGLPGEPATAGLRCLAEARRLKAAYCSVNVYRPRLGAAFLPEVSRARRLAAELGAGVSMAVYDSWKHMEFLLGRLDPGLASPPRDNPAHLRHGDER